jgi:hypothetical protein
MACFSFGVDAADADQAWINGMSKEYNFVISAFVVLFLGCLFIFLSSRVFLIYACIGFCFFVLRRDSERICA